MTGVTQRRPQAALQWKQRWSMAGEGKKIAVVVGTRPEAIKMAPVIHALERSRDEFELLVIAAAQHRQMLDQALTLFHITPHVDLELMQPDQTLSGLTSRALRALDQILSERRPDLVLVQGDTTTVLAASLAAFYQTIAVAHVEAGLRSHDIRNPFPEEVNRHCVAVVADMHLAPTPLARENLLREGVPEADIAVTGNTVVDALLDLLQRPFFPEESPLAAVPLEQGRVVLVTSHRRESWGPQLENICLALGDLVDAFPDLRVVYPVHLNPRVRATVEQVLRGRERIYLLPPLDYLTFLNLMRRCSLVLTDSGGVQEEAPTLRKPVLVLRRLTERPEASQCGMARVIGTKRGEIVAAAARLLRDRAAYRAMTAGGNPYGDGHAAERILQVLRRWRDHQLPLLPPEQEFHPAERREAAELTHA